MNSPYTIVSPTELQLVSPSLCEQLICSRDPVHVIHLERDNLFRAATVSRKFIKASQKTFGLQYTQR